MVGIVAADAEDLADGVCFSGAEAGGFHGWRLSCVLTLCADYRAYAAEMSRQIWRKIILTISNLTSIVGG
jgi:hypothetical protein